YFYFRQLTPRTYDLRKTYPRDAAVLPFWSHVRHKRIAVIDAPEITMTLGGLPGIQLANWSTHQMDARRVRAVSEPAALLSEARRVYGPQIYVTDFELDAGVSEQLAAYRRLMDRVERKGTLCRHLLAHERFDLIVAGFFEAHTGSHRFWDHRADAHP